MSGGVTIKKDRSQDVGTATRKKRTNRKMFREQKRTDDVLKGEAEDTHPLRIKKKENMKRLKKRKKKTTRRVPGRDVPYMGRKGRRSFDHQTKIREAIMQGKGRGRPMEVAPESRAFR